MGFLPTDRILSAGSAMVNFETVGRLFRRRQDRIRHVIYGNQVGCAVEMAVQSGERSGAESYEQSVRAIEVVDPSRQWIDSSPCE